MGAGKVTLSMVTLVLKPELILFSDQNGNANSKKYMKYINFVIIRFYDDKLWLNNWLQKFYIDLCKLIPEYVVAKYVCK